jgi:hypothetical protein
MRELIDFGYPYLPTTVYSYYEYAFRKKLGVLNEEVFILYWRSDNRANEIQEDFR